MNQRMQVALRSGKGKEINSPVEAPEGIQPCCHLDFRTSDLQNYKIINLSFKPLSLW